MSYRKHHVKSKIKKLKPKNSILKNRWFWLVILIAGMVGVIAWLFFFASFLQADNILISGNKEIKIEDIKSIVEKNANMNIFLVSASNIQKEILNAFPEIKLVEVKKNYFKTISIKVEERSSVVIFCSLEDFAICYLVDENGIIFQEHKETKDNLVIITKEPKDSQVLLGQKIVEKNILEAILKIQKTLKDNYAVDVKEALIQNKSRLNIKTSENWQIYFDIDSDLNTQVTKLDLLLKEEIIEQARKNLQYIDLRFKDKAYYK